MTERTLLGEYLELTTPKFTREIAEGLSYHKLTKAIDFIDGIVKFACLDRTQTHLRYLGIRKMSPDEEFDIMFKRRKNRPYELADNSMYLVELTFHYGDEEEPRHVVTYLPYVRKGNEMTINGREVLIMPTMADKVISVGENVIFINVVSAKHTFVRVKHTISENGINRNIPIVVTELYNNAKGGLNIISKAKHTVMHYILSWLGYDQAMKQLLGFVPEPVYSSNKKEGYVVYGSTGDIPDGFITQNNRQYTPNNISFLVPKELDSPEVAYILGNVLYLLDNFSCRAPGRLAIQDLNDPELWLLILGELIHSLDKSISWRYRKMKTHFEGHLSQFDRSTITKLEDVARLRNTEINATNLMELLVVIMKNYNEWILASESRSLFYNKTMEVESYVLSTIRGNLVKLLLEINKEEANLAPGEFLDKRIVDSAFNKHLRGINTLYGLRRNTTFVSSTEDSTGNLYYKRTARIAKQESDFTQQDMGTTNTSTRDKIDASWAAVGSLLYLSKSDPTPLGRINPFCRLDEKLETIIPDPSIEFMVNETNKLLYAPHMSGGMDITDRDNVTIDLDGDGMDLDEDSCVEDDSSDMD